MKHRHNLRLLGLVVIAAITVGNELHLQPEGQLCAGGQPIVVREGLYGQRNVVGGENTVQVKGLDGRSGIWASTVADTFDTGAPGKWVKGNGPEAYWGWYTENGKKQDQKGGQYGESQAQYCTDGVDGEGGYFRQ